MKLTRIAVCCRSSTEKRTQHVERVFKDTATSPAKNWFSLQNGARQSMQPRAQGVRESENRVKTSAAALPATRDAPQSVTLYCRRISGIPETSPCPLFVDPALHIPRHENSNCALWTIAITIILYSVRGIIQQNSSIVLFLLLCLCILIICLCIIIVPTGTLRLPWLMFSCVFSSVVRQMSG